MEPALKGSAQRALHRPQVLLPQTVQAQLPLLRRQRIRPVGLLAGGGEVALAARRSKHRRSACGSIGDASLRGRANCSMYWRSSGITVAEGDRALFHVQAVAKGVAARAHPATGSGAGFEDAHGVPGAHQFVGGHEAGNACPDHRHALRLRGPQRCARQRQRPPRPASEACRKPRRSSVGMAGCWLLQGEAVLSGAGSCSRIRNQAT